MDTRELFRDAVKLLEKLSYNLYNKDFPIRQVETEINGIADMLMSTASVKNKKTGMAIKECVLDIIDYEKSFSIDLLKSHIF